MGSLLYIIAVILVIAWLIGFVGYSAGGLIHILLVIAIIAVLLNIIGGSRRAVLTCFLMISPVPVDETDLNQRRHSPKPIKREIEKPDMPAPKGMLLMCPGASLPRVFFCR